MEFHGIVHNGVIVFSGGASLPEGTSVTISCDVKPEPAQPTEKKPVEFPLVRTGKPGSLNLTNERIAEILDEDDVASSRR